MVVLIIEWDKSNIVVPKNSWLDSDFYNTYWLPGMLFDSIIYGSIVVHRPLWVSREYVGAHSTFHSCVIAVYFDLNMSKNNMQKTEGHNYSVFVQCEGGMSHNQCL